MLDRRYDDVQEQKKFIFSGIFEMINRSPQTTKNPQMSPGTIEIPKFGGDREKEAYEKLQGISALFTIYIHDDK